jgi:hypothetical protein
MPDDNLAEDVDRSLKNGGTGCLGVAKGDFDGDGRPDFVLALTGGSGNGLIVVALSRKDSWLLQTLETLPEGRNRLYVDVGRPSHFERVSDLDVPLEHGELQRMRCAHEAAIFGATESTGTAYCLGKGGWKHVHFSD